MTVVLFADSLLWAGENLPFTIALAVMVGIGILEGVATVLGMGLSGVLDNLLPDADLDADIDLDADAELPSGAGVMTRALGWMHVGRVPTLVLLIIFLLCFGLSGLALQYTLHGALGWLLPGLVAALPAFAAGLWCVRLLGGVITRALPKDETSAVSRRSFVGRVATITAATAKRNTPAQAKLKDQHGQTHYILVEPDVDSEEFTAGTEVIVVRQVGARFTVIRNTSPALQAPPATSAGGR